MFQLDGKIAAVTGAGSGIGRAIANTFAHAGARVFVLERDSGAGEETLSGP
ncbi:MAG TPA: SDR family NAD(P)-dependent oxidoreductase [Candidatus Binataceae bacterium]|nr:SDR family NAD(P)-dependent oxidoreductase [Candidatus Binataceae bacterium]